MNAKAVSMKPVPMSAFQLQAESGDLSEHNGIAAVYDVEIERMFSVLELAPGCFKESIADPDSVVILNQHDSWEPIGKAKAFEDKSDELLMDFLLNPGVRKGAEAISNIEHGILTGLSVGFSIMKSEIREEGEGPRAYEVTRVVEAELSEVSCVTWPALDGARIQNAKGSAKEGVVTFAIEQMNEGRRNLKPRDADGELVRLATFAPIRRARVTPASATQEQLAQVSRELDKLLDLCK